MVSYLTQRARLIDRGSYQVAVRLSKADYERVEALVETGLYRSSADFLREAVRDKLREMEIVGVRDVTEEEAKKLIGEHLAQHPGPQFASEIAETLGLEYNVTFKVIGQMLKEGTLKKAKT